MSKLPPKWYSRYERFYYSRPWLVWSVIWFGGLFIIWLASRPDPLDSALVEIIGEHV